MEPIISENHLSMETKHRRLDLGWVGGRGWGVGGGEAEEWRRNLRFLWAHGSTQF